MSSKQTYQGLTPAQVAESRKLYGENILTPPEKESLFQKYLCKLSDPLIVILLIAGALSISIALYERFVLHEDASVFFEPVGIFVAILLATGLGFYFEVKAEGEFALLNRVNDEEPVQVIREGKSCAVPRKDIVVGDIVILSTGEEVPADGELLEAVNLGIDESTLTGEPICHKSILPEEFDPDATFPSNHVMKGTKVMEGHGVMKVKAVGDHTENGKVFVAAQIDNSVKTPLNLQLEGLARVLAAFSYSVAGLIIVGRMVHYFDWNPLAWLLALPTVFFFYLVICRFPKWRSTACLTAIALFLALFIGGTLALNHQLHAGTLDELLSSTLQTLMIAVTLIVVSVPEGLPMAVTLSLAFSMRRMLKTNNLVRKMHACETMGAITVICTDKTGTLTRNQMSVSEARFYGLKDLQTLSGDGDALMIAEGIAANSTASLEETEEGFNVLGNPTEGALLLWLQGQGADYRKLKEAVEKIEELPFSTERKYMATVVRSSVLAGRRVLYVKGAPEMVWSLCARPTVESVTKEQVDAELAAYQKKAMRTLGFAYQILEDGDATISGEGRVVAERLVFLGITAIADPVRDEVPAAVEDCTRAGIQIKIVTGDTPGTASEIGRQIGLWKEQDGERNLITGPEFEALSDEELWERIDDLKIIARARPMDKKRLVETLQKKGQVVAVTGDGTNDAPALKAAHVGLSMGDGTGVAKEASDITIIDNSFSSIARAVMWGRSLYRNIRRFILFQMTVSLIACLIVLFGAFFGTESPLTVTQMLWVNLIMDTFAAMALASLPPSADVMNEAPRPRTDFIINRTMAWMIGGMGVVFTALLLVLLIFLQNHEVTACTALLNPTSCPTGGKGLSPFELSLFFTFFVFIQFWNMFNTRAFMTHSSAFHFKGCGSFLTIAGFILIGQILIVTFGGPMFQVTPLSLSDWLIILGATSLILWVGELLRLLTPNTPRR